MFPDFHDILDSEWAFALLLSKVSQLFSMIMYPILTQLQLPDPNARSFTPEVLRKAMLETISSINEYTESAGITEPSLMNFCVTDGETVIATRYISSRTEEAASLVRH